MFCQGVYDLLGKTGPWINSAGYSFGRLFEKEFNILPDLVRKNNGCIIGKFQ